LTHLPFNEASDVGLVEPAAAAGIGAGDRFGQPSAHDPFGVVSP
jgi:hypothetical protein